MEFVLQDKSNKNIFIKAYQGVLGTCPYEAKNYEINKWLNGLMT
jgi:hypothetical protein